MGRGIDRCDGICEMHDAWLVAGFGILARAI